MKRIAVVIAVAVGAPLIVLACALFGAALGALGVAKVIVDAAAKP